MFHGDKTVAHVKYADSALPCPSALNGDYITGIELSYLAAAAA